MEAGDGGAGREVRVRGEVSCAGGAAEWECGVCGAGETTRDYSCETRDTGNGNGATVGAAVRDGWCEAASGVSVVWVGVAGGCGAVR